MSFYLSAACDNMGSNSLINMNNVCMYELNPRVTPSYIAYLGRITTVCSVGGPTYQWYTYIQVA